MIMPQRGAAQSSGPWRCWRTNARTWPGDTTCCRRRCCRHPRPAARLAEPPPPARWVSYGLALAALTLAIALVSAVVTALAVTTAA